MKCEKCGTEFEAEYDICPHCGWMKTEDEQDSVTVQDVPPADIPETNDVPKTVTVQNVSPVDISNANIVRSTTADELVFYIKKTFLVGVLAVLAFIIVALIALSMLISFLNRTDVTDFLLVESEGFNSRGVVTYQVDTDAVLEKVFKTSDISDLKMDEQKKYRELVNLLQKGISVDGNLSNVSNGDTVVISVENVDEISEKTGISFKKNAEKSFTVSNLKESDSFMVEDALDVKFVGYDGAGCVEISVKSSSIPVNSSYYGGNELYFEEIGQSCSLHTSGNEGALSNGDTFTISFEENSSLNEKLLEKYGCFLDDAGMEITVEGLQEPETLDVFSKLDLSVGGLEGNGELSYRWQETDFTQGNIHVTVYNEQSQDFSIYTTASVPKAPMYFAENSQNYENETKIATVSVRADNSRKLKNGDVVNVNLCQDYSDGTLDSDDYATQGVVFKDVTYTIDVDDSMLSRLITSDEQFDGNAVKEFGESYSEEVSEYLMENWSRIVHDSYNFTCYEQTIVNTPYPTKAYFCKTDTRSNTYTMWIPFSCICRDSELTEDIRRLVMVTVYSPALSGGENPKISTFSSVDFSYYKSEAELEDAWWYRSNGSNIHYFEYE